MIHTSAGFVLHDFGTFDFWIGNIFNSLARVGVPLFVMISGTIFLDEKYDLTIHKIKSHIIRIAVLFIFWSVSYAVIYNILIPIIKHDSVSMKSMLLDVFIGYDHLWFCFMIVGLYLIAPLLRLWVKKENKKQIQYFLLLSFTFTMFIPCALKFLSLIFPALIPLNTIIDNLNICYVGGYTAYFVLGWYLSTYELKQKTTIIALGIAGFLVSIVGTAILSIGLNEAHQTYDSISTHVAFQAITVYSLVYNKYREKIEGKRIVFLLARHSLGIYAIHEFFVGTILACLSKIGIITSVLCIPITFVVSIVFSFSFAFIFSKIPILKKVV